MKTTVKEMKLPLRVFFLEVFFIWIHVGEKFLISLDGASAGSSGFVSTCVRVLLICKCGCSNFYTNVIFVESHTEITIDELCGFKCNTGPVSLKRDNSDLFCERNAEADIWMPVVKETFLIIRPIRCTNFSNLLWNETLHVSDSSSVHHQEFFTVHTSVEYVI